MGGTFGGAGASALSDLIALGFPVTNDGSLPQRAGLDQPTVEEILKARVLESQGWNSASDSLFAGLPEGVPFVVGLIAKIAEQITGIDVGVWIEQWESDPVVATLQAIVQDALASIFTVQVNIQSLLGALDFTDPDFDLDEAIRAFINLVLLPTQLIANWAELFQRLTGLSGGTLPDLGDLLNDGLFGRITSGRLGLLPTGLVGDMSPNLVADPDFKSQDFNGSGVFVRDETTGYDGAFSAKVIADGSGAKDMLEKAKHDVDRGQDFYLSVWVKWSGASGTGTPIHLGLTEYNALGEAVGQPDVVLRAISPSSTDFVQMSGTYKVPASNVSAILLRWGISPGATAGTFHFSRVELRPTGSMPTRVIAELDDALDDLFGGLDATFDSLLEKVGLDDFDDLLNTLGGGLGSTLTQIQNRLNDFLHGSSTLNASNIGLGQLADEFNSGVRNLFTSIFSGLRNITRPGDDEVTRDDAYDALLALADGVTGLGARVATLETVFTSGISTGDDFERTSSTSLGPKWLVYYKGSGSGVVATPNGHDASWITSGFGDREFLAIFNSPESTDFNRSATPNQRVLLPMASAAEAVGFLGIYAATDAWLRISDDTTGWANVTGIQIRFWANGKVEIWRWVGGNPTLLNQTADGAIPNPGPGHIIGGEAGAPGVGRYFKAILGSNGVLDIPEVGNASGYGGAYQRWGFGGLANGNLLTVTIQQKPGALRQWTAMDQ